MGSVVAAVRLIGALVCLSGGMALAAPCSPDVAEVRGTGAVARFAVEIADDPGERATGLMNRDSMPSSAGMLFVYPTTQRARFWMRNTRIPLDMIFIDPTGTVTRVHENAVPMDETGIDGGPGVLLVLEINGGLARRLGIGVGAVLRHPAVPQDQAIWPCE